MAAPWNRQAVACPVSPCSVDRLFHDKTLRQWAREARRDAAGEALILHPVQKLPCPVQGVPLGVQGAHLPVQDPPYRLGDAGRWRLLDTARTNLFAPSGVAERLERELQVAPCGEEIASLCPSAQWMGELGVVMVAHGVTNHTAVLIGAQRQLYMLDDSPRARVGETVNDPCAEEFPVKLYRAATPSMRMRPSPSSPTSPRMFGPPSPMRSTSPPPMGSEGGE